MISSLATSKYLTDKHYEERNGNSIKYLIPHHMAGKKTGAGCAYYFQNNGYQNSANYCIGYAGDISCNVEEQYGAWTSSFGLADKYAITFEVSDVDFGDWRIPQKAQDALISLWVDLIKRYPSLGSKAIFDPSDEAEVVSAKRAYRQIGKTKGNVLLHVWTSAYGTSCPEWHMIKILPDICAEVNRRLAGGGDKTIFQIAQEVIDGKWGNGQARRDALRAAGYDPDVVQAQVDKMLAKDSTINVEILTKCLNVLQKNSSGNEVKALQMILADMGYLTVAPDGIFGNYTETALKQFQTNINTVYGNFGVDGKCGEKTWRRMLLGQ